MSWLFFMLNGFFLLEAFLRQDYGWTGQFDDSFHKSIRIEIDSKKKYIEFIGRVRRKGPFDLIRQNMRKWLGGLLAGLMAFTVVFPMTAVRAAASGNETDNQIKKVLSSDNFTVALSQSGKLWAWGNNDFGQLGNGNTEPSIVPVRVSIPGDPVIVDFGVSTFATYGQRFVVALDADGHVWHWGQYWGNNWGQNGEGWIIPSPDKVMIDESTALSNIKAIAVGSYFVYALTEDGNVYSWGFDSSKGELGQGLAPGMANVKFADFVVDANGDPLQNVVQIAAGRSFGLALTEDRTVYAWGSNKEGQLTLDESIESIGHAVEVPSLGQVDAIFTSGYSQFAFASTVTGAVYGWGENKNENLGFGPYGDYRTPVVIDGLHAGDIQTIRPAATFTMVLMKDGTLLSSGFSSNVLGDNSSTFVARHYETVGTIDDVHVSHYQVFLLSGGSGWALGRNEIDSVPYTGLLGTGYNFDKTESPVRMAELAEYEAAVKNVELLDVSVVKDRLTVKAKDQMFSTHEEVWFGVYPLGDPSEPVNSYTYWRSNDSEYEFEAVLEPGDYEIALYTLNGNEQSPIERYDNAGQGFAIEEGKASLTIQVTSRKDGQPVEDREIRLERLGTEDFEFVNTDSQGMAHFDGLYYGFYRIKLNDGSQTWYNVSQGIYLTDGENHLDVKLVPTDEVVELWPSSIAVEDTGHLSQHVSWQNPGTGLDQITEFRIWFVDANGGKIGEDPAATVQKSYSTYDYEFTNVPVPEQAVALELFAFDGTSERSMKAKAHLWRDRDTYIIPNAYVADENPSPGQLDMTIHWQEPKEPAGIASFYLGLEFNPFDWDWYKYQGSYFVAEIPKTGDSQYTFTLPTEFVENGMALFSFFTIGVINESGVKSPESLIVDWVDNISWEERLSYASRDSDLDMTGPVYFVNMETEPGKISGWISGEGPGTSFDVVALDADGNYLGSLLRIYKFLPEAEHFYAMIPPGTPVPSDTAMLAVYAREYDWIGYEPAIVQLDIPSGEPGSGEPGSGEPGNGEPGEPPLVLATGIGKLSGNEILFIPEGTTRVAFLEKLQLSAGASAGVLNADPNSPVEDGDILRVQSNANLYTDYTLETLTTSLKTRLTGFGDQIGIRHIVYFAKQIQTDVTDDGVFDKQDLVELLRKIEPFVPYVRDNVAN